MLGPRQCMSEAASVCKSARRRGAEPLPPSPPPQKKQAAEAGVGQRQYCFSHHAWRGWVMGQEEEGWIRGVSRAPCPSHPGGSVGRTLRLAEAQEWPTPIGGRPCLDVPPLGLALP